MGALDASQEYVRQRFRDYYTSDQLILPERFGRREWGFIPFGGGTIQRHLGFASKKELLEFLVKRGPSHAYHSAAYYEKPGAPTMPEKGWLGADLIFDLDADHIPGAKEMGYRGMLEAVKGQTIHLLDEFLLGDLGFEERWLHLAFSGARGYHIHVRDPRVLPLESHERRELVDYIIGTELDLQGLAWTEAVAERRFRNRVEAVRTLAIPRASEPGWGGRLTRGLQAWVEGLAAMPVEDAVGGIASLEGIGRKGAEKIYDTIFVHLGKEKAMERLAAGTVDFFPPGIGMPQLMAMASSGVHLMRGATDEPVTSDIKRLIRLMGSLHGKTGLRVTPLTRERLDDFDPLRDAVPSTFTDERVEVHLAKNVQLDIKGEAFMLAQGTVSVPQYVAIFMICRGMATLAPGPAHELIRRQDHHQPQVRQGA